jgi:hypothetical protein
MLAKKHYSQKNLSKKGFSLKGNSCNQSFIGKTREISCVRTIYRGLTPLGHGGNQGKYTKNILIGNNKKNTDSRDSTSTMTTSGYISTRIKNPIVCNDDSCSRNWVKTFNPLEHSQGDHVKKKRIKNACVLVYSDSGIKPTHDNCSDTYYVGSRKMTRATYTKEADSGAMPSSEYTDTILYRKKCLPTPDCKQPFPMILNNRNNCAKNYFTPEEAQADGLLPKDWMSCTSDAFKKNPYT